MNSLIHLFIHSFFLFISFMFLHSFIRSFIHPFIHSFVHSFTHTMEWDALPTFSIQHSVILPLLSASNEVLALCSRTRWCSSATPRRPSYHLIGRSWSTARRSQRFGRSSSCRRVTTCCCRTLRSWTSTQEQWWRTSRRWTQRFQTASRKISTRPWSRWRRCTLQYPDTVLIMLLLFTPSVSEWSSWVKNTMSSRARPFANRTATAVQYWMPLE